jgi:hypothetical protein
MCESPVLRKSQKQHVFCLKYAFLEKGHNKKLLGPPFLESACFSDAGTTFGVEG